MLLTKYQSSRPSTFREKEFRNWSSLFLCSNLWTPWQDQSWPKGFVWTNLVEVHKEMLHTKYQGSRPSSLRVEELWNFHSLFLCFKLVIPRAGLVLSPGAFMNKLGRGSLGDATYQISNLYAIQFQRRKILKMCFFVPMFQLMTPGEGPVLIPGASYEHTW